jgi:hypothetical protein
MTDASQDIDAVVLWVDGDDPVHRQKLDNHLASIGRRPHSAHPTRFRSVGEVDYCIRSILKFAPFVRRIHVVTDAQVPAIFETASAWPKALRHKLALVDHRQIFAGHEDCLPTFNSLAIESLLHRVPGLAEQFIYLNDDMMLIRPVAPTALFREGRPVLHGRYVSMPELRLAWRVRALWRKVSRPEPGSLRASNTLAQALGARMAGARGRFLLAGHNPHPLRRSTIDRYFTAHPQALQRNLAYPLRDAAQFAPTALAHHLELQIGHAIVEPDDCCLYLKPASKGRTATRIAAAAVDARKTFACVQSLDEADDAVQRQVVAWIDQLTRFDAAA